MAKDELAAKRAERAARDAEAKAKKEWQEYNDRVIAEARRKAEEQQRKDDE